MKYFYTQQKAFYNDPCCDAPTTPDIVDNRLIGREVYNVERHPISGYTFDLEGYHGRFYAPWKYYLAVYTPGKRETELVYIGASNV